MQYWLWISVFLHFMWSQKPRCTPDYILQKFNLTPAEVNFTSSICPNLTSTVGSCVNETSLSLKINSTIDWYKIKSVDALNYASLMQNATLYWQAVSGFYTPPSTSSSYLVNLFINMKQYLSTYFIQFSDWVSNNIKLSTEAIPPCFQAMANISTGLFCSMAAKNNLKFGPSNGRSKPEIPIGVVANSTVVGKALQVCLPLIDTYCSLSYGVSIVNSQLPFNGTFNWGDGAISVTICQNLRRLYNCTTQTCNDKQKLIVVDLFYTNWMPFVPSADHIASLSVYLETLTNSTVFTPSKYGMSGVGVSALNNLGSEGVDFYGLGIASGVPPATYTAQIIHGISLTVFSVACVLIY